MQLRIDCTGRSTGTITDYLVNSVSEMIETAKLPAGTRLPSIRSFSEQNHISRFTVVQVYDRLVAKGLLHSRRGSGFYVSDTTNKPVLIDDNANLIKTVLDTCKIHLSARVSPGNGTLPSSWLDDAGLERAIRRVGRGDLSDFLDGYSDINGYLPLREQLQHRLLGIGISAHVGQIITTSGAIPSIDLLCRTVLKPGDTVITDEPGYYTFNSLLKGLDAKRVGVEWSKTGPDLEQLEALAKKYQPKLYITSAVNQNPTGVTLSPATIHQVLGLAEKYQFKVVEDDIFGVFHDNNPMRYATLDQFKNVVYINSYSKTISGKLRVGYMVVPESLIESVQRNRLLGARTSELAERVVSELLGEGSYRKHVIHLIDRLQKARERTVETFTELGFEFFTVPEYGPFLWARLKGLEDSNELSIAAQKRDIHLLPGHYFLTDGQTSPWLRFSVAWCNDPELIRFLKDYVSGRG